MYEVFTDANYRKVREILEGLNASEIPSLSRVFWWNRKYGRDAPVYNILLRNQEVRTRISPKEKQQEPTAAIIAARLKQKKHSAHILSTDSRGQLQVR